MRQRDRTGKHSNYRYKRAAITLLLNAVALLPLQGLTTAAETGTWVDGDMPQLVVGSKRTDAGFATCSQRTFYYHSYTKPDGTHDNNGRLLPVSVCVYPTAFGFIGTTSSAQYISFNGFKAYKILDSIGRNTAAVGAIPGQDSRFYYAPPTISSDPSSYLMFFDSFGQAGTFGEYSAEEVYKLNLIDPSVPLQDSAGSRIRLMLGRAFSSDGKWIVIEADGLGLLRINTETREMLLFSTEKYRYDLGFFPHISLAISDDGNTVIRSGLGMANAKVFDLSGCQAKPFVMGSTTNTTPGCRSRAVQDSLVLQHAGFDGMDNMRFTDGGKTIRGVVAIKNASGVREYYDMTYSVAGYQSTQLSYLALGDSFSSGEGAYEYEQGTDDPLNKCHLSKQSYSYLIAESLSIANFHSVACSGALIDDYYNVQHKGQKPESSLGQWLPGYQGQKEYFKFSENLHALTISLGGNDIGFADKLQECVASLGTCKYAGDPTARGEVAKEIVNLSPGLEKLYKEIIADTGGKTKIYVIGYPQIINAAMLCQSNVHFNLEESIFARRVTNYLNQVIQAAVNKAGVHYVDIEESLEGSNLCSGIGDDEQSVNGLSEGDDIAIPWWKKPFVKVATGTTSFGNESYHPNAKGHAKMAVAIKTATNDDLIDYPLCAGQSQGTIICPQSNVQIPLPSQAYFGDAAVNYVKSLNSPATSSPTVVEQIVPDLEPILTGSGDNLQIRVQQDNLLPGSVIKLELRSDPTTLGTYTVGSDGTVDVTLQIPETVAAGYHTLHMLGTHVTGQSVDYYQPVMITGDEGDLDKDSIPDAQDPCGFVEASGSDQDRDGIDDACDGHIAELPPDTTPPLVTGNPDRAPGANGWYKSDVIIDWAVSDPDPSSGSPTQPPQTIAGLEGVHAYTSELSCDPLNNCATGSLELKIDKTAPEITYTLEPSPNAAGWNKSAVTVTFTCADAVSGVASCTGPQTVSGADGTYVVIGSAVDHAGNNTDVNAFVSLDRTNPSVTQAISPVANADGWHNTDVAVEPSCSDNLSGILHCSPAVMLSNEGAHQVVTSTAEDLAGNSATATANVSIDKTAPTVGAPSWDNNPKSLFGIANIALPASDNLSGIAEAEYFLGDADPGQGNGATMQVQGGSISVGFAADFPTGVYKVTVRAKDKAGNWSAPVSDYLVVYDPFGTRMTGQKTLIPSLASGDTLPGLTGGAQADKAKFGFNVRYDDQGNMHRNSDFQFKYETGTKCNKSTQAVNCHSFELNAVVIDWLTTQGTNDSTGIFQGTAALTVDGLPSTVTFRLTGLDGERLDPVNQDHLMLKIYSAGVNPTNPTTPMYQVNADVLRGNIKIRRW